MKLVTLFGGPADGKRIEVNDNIEAVRVPVIVNVCTHVTDPLLIASPIATYTKSESLPSALNTNQEYWYTNFESEVAGWWCQQCEMDRQEKRDYIEEKNKFMHDMKERLHDYIEDLNEHDYYD